MDQVLQRMQTQAVNDIANVMQQHQALRRFQTDLVRQQFHGANPSGHSARSSQSTAEAAEEVIDVEAKVVPLQPSSEKPVG